MTQTTQQSTAHLVKQAAEQISTLVRDELMLAQRELAAKSKHAGLGAGLFGSGALTVAYAMGALVAAAILGLATVMPAWISALIIGAVLLLIAGLQVALGRSQMRRATPPGPNRTMERLRTDIDTVAHAVEEGRRR